LLSLGSFGLKTLISYQCGFNKGTLLNNLPLHHIAATCGLPLTSFLFKTGFAMHPNVVKYVPLIIPIEFVTTRYFTSRALTKEKTKMSWSTKLALSLALESPLPLTEMVSTLKPNLLNAGVLQQAPWCYYYSPGYQRNESLHHNIHTRAVSWWNVVAYAPPVEELIKAVHYVAPTLFGIYEHVSLSKAGIASNVIDRIVRHNLVSLPTVICNVFKVTNVKLFNAAIILSTILHGTNNAMAMQNLEFETALGQFSPQQEFYLGSKIELGEI
jgi:hypothetical protein